MAVPLSVIGLIHAIRLPIGLMGPMLPNGLIQPCLIGTNHSIQQCLMGTNRSIGLMQPCPMMGTNFPTGLMQPCPMIVTTT